MRNSVLCAACAAALAFTAYSPAEAKAQIIYTYPSGYSVPYYPGGIWPSFNYGYNFGYATPYTTNWNYGWSNPWNYGNYSWSTYRYNPYLDPRPYGFARWPNYMYRR
jgi:hypothetical protein